MVRHPAFRGLLMAACLAIAGMTGACSASQLAAVQTFEVKSTAKLEAICQKAGQDEPLLLPIATIGATAIAGANGAAAVTATDTIARAACAGVNATYVGLQASVTPTAAPAAPAPSTAPTPAPSPSS